MIQRSQCRPSRLAIGLLWTSLLTLLLLSRPHRFCCAWTIPTLVRHNVHRTLSFIPASSPHLERLRPLRDTAETASGDLETTNASTTANTATLALENADTDDDEYEYLEFDNLTEQEFIASEWLVGTNWDRSPNKIDETWARLIVDADGKNVVVWGDESKGTWALDVATQFLSLSKENILAGKQIWACTVNDYYYLQGTVRGWTYWSAAAVIGQWQARRLGVDREEAGTPPWFEDVEDDMKSQ